MQIEEIKLNKIAKILVGLPLKRYMDKEDAINQKVIENKSIDELDEQFEFEEYNISKNIKKQFYSQEHDILYKVQQQSFAKEITTETGAIIPNSYIIIRVDNKKVNSKFLANYLNDPRVDYEIQRKIDSTTIMKVNSSILKDLTVILPEKDIQDINSEPITKINERINLKKKSIDNDEQMIHSLFDKIIGDKYEKKHNTERC